MNVLIIDDEQKSINNLTILLKEYCPSISAISSSLNITNGELLIRKKKFDLIFLDIEMPDGNGFDLVENIKDLNLNIIFVTAFNSYAIDAFRNDAVDYLLKPIDIDLLKLGIKKVEKKISFQTLSIGTSTNLDASNYGKIKLPTVDGFELLDTKDIIHIKAAGSYSEIYTKHDLKIIVSKSIGEIEKKLGPVFLRIHDKYVVNTNEIVKYVKGRGGYVILRNNTELEVSFRKKHLLLDLETI
jgi:two-component system, LytTR family, response regulator